MKLLIILFYNSEQGGLHDNVFSTAIESQKRGYEVFVACRRGVFQETLKDNGINIVEIDQQKKIWSVNNIINVVGTDIDLIHSHPGISREISLLLHDEYKIPVIYHVHGAWTDSIHHYIHKLESVFAVSESVKQRISTYCKNHSHLVHVIPNYSDYTINKDTNYLFHENSKIITLITRLEHDKKLIIDEVKKLSEFLNNTDDVITFNILGDGSLKNDLKYYFEENVNNINIEIKFKGWVSDKEELKSHIINSDIVIGPGRVAIDSHKIGTPVIVLGSQNYYGIINDENWQEFVSSNFGGLGPKSTSQNQIENDLKTLLYNKEEYINSVQVGHKVIDTFFDKEKTLEKLFNIYDIVLSKNRLQK